VAAPGRLGWRCLIALSYCLPPPGASRTILIWRRV